VEELPDDLLEFHEAVNSLQQQEEDVIDEHRELVGVNTIILSWICAILDGNWISNYHCILL